MFDIPNLQTVNEMGSRFYVTPQQNYYPSITSILGKTETIEKQESLKKWRSSLGDVKAAEVTRRAADRGTNVHLLIERYLKGEDVKRDQFSTEDFNSFVALKTKLKFIDEVWGQECSLYSDLLEVAGRCDCVAVYKGVPSIIDYKTSTRLKKPSEIADYKLQFTFKLSDHADALIARVDKFYEKLNKQLLRT